MFLTLGQVALGGALGASARYLTGVAAMRMLGPGFPWGTLIVNVVGSLAMGAIITLLANLSATRFGPFLMVGILGGFTTFSSFALDAVTLWERGAMISSAAYVIASVSLSLAAVFAGMLLVRQVFV